MGHLDLIEDRDPDFWDRIATHPDVAPHVFLGLAEISLSEMVSHPSVTPLRTENGGFLFCRLDGLGRVHELHTLFTPEGWGREVLGAAKQAFALMFARGSQVVTTYEIDGWWRSRPPRSFGFKAAGPFAACEFGSLKTWIMTREAWEQSPVGRP